MVFKVNKMIKNFNDYLWHDAIIKNIFIDRKNPGYKDTIAFEIFWTYPNEKFNQIVFEDVYIHIIKKLPLSSMC